MATSASVPETLFFTFLKKINGASLKLSERNLHNEFQFYDLSPGNMDETEPGVGGTRL